MLATPTSSSSHSPLPPPTPTTTATTTNTIAAGLIISPQRRQELLGTITSPRCSSRSGGGARQHTLHVVIRVLKSWPRLMAMHGASPSHLPPMIHPVQLEPHAAALPVPLANCFALAKLWATHTRDNTAQLVHDAASQEVQRLLHSHHTYTAPTDLLAAAQALLILMTILFFGLPDLPNPDPDRTAAEAQTLIAAWPLKHALALTGLFDPAELASPQRVPDDWRAWAFVSAKRRTILALHHLEWAWSLAHGRPVLTCFELGPLPAPAAGCVWRARSEREWRGEYGGWLGRWEESGGGGYRMVEFFGIRAGEELGVRGEMWLAEADEFGVLLMAEGESVFSRSCCGGGGGEKGGG